MINNTTLVGRLARDPELRFTGSGVAVTNFTMAVDRDFTNAQGERETDFIDCVIWRGSAENLSKFAVKGTLIGITGSIQTRDYQNKEGQTVYVTEVRADKFQLLEPKAVNDERRNKAAATTRGQGNKKKTSSGWSDKGNNESQFQGNTSNVTDDDYPF